ncbi:MAG TPA: hypothetical protein VD706_03570 [Candidatus Saccharimonadales bacterium]|nr:hypothetical protein [Candidatus Saccharimonadales bacterium]
MGPLEEGDQKLVDAVHRLPADRHVMEMPNGGFVRTVKHEIPGGLIANAEVSTPDGATERAGTLIDTVPRSSGNDVIADIAEWPAGEQFGRTTDEAVGNKVRDEGEDKDLFAMRHDRAEAQAIKLKVAGKLEQATRHLSDNQIQDRELARDMAEAERPHRDTIAERQEAAAVAQQVAALAVSRFRKGTGTLEAVSRTGERADMMKRTTTHDIALERAHAQEAAETVRQERQS